MILALGVSGFLILAAVVLWYAVHRSSQAHPLAVTELPHDTLAGATTVPAEPSAGPSTDVPEETDETENSDGRDRKPTGKLSLLGDLAAGIAHEINNPVAIMLEEAGWIEDLLEEEEFRQSENLEEFKRALTQIKTQGARCKAIIQNLVSFGQKKSLKVGEVHINDLVAEVVKTHEKRVRAGNVKIDSHFAESLPDCRLSPSEMQQVLDNLINNALDAVDPQNGRVSVSTRTDGQDVVISVSDNGPGIPKAHLDRIFDPFFTTKPVGKGTGLGLSICYGLIEKMGGTINVESEPGRGTTFHIRLPSRQPEGQPVSAAVPDAEGGEGAGQEPTPATMGGAPIVVLLVDDEVPFVEALRKRLARRGMEVLTAFSGEEALRELQRKRDVDIVLLGVNMPGMGGIETLREVKVIRPLVEVILLSADTTVESAIEGIKLGAFDYLIKPCDMGQLLDKIEKARRRKRRQEQKIMEVRIKEITSRRI